MPYEKIESLARRNNGPTLVVSSGGRFRLNAEATGKFREVGASRVAILWDKQHRKLALKVAPENDISAFRLTYSKAQNSADIGAKAFLAQVALSTDRKSVYVQLTWNEAESMYEGRLPK